MTQSKEREAQPREAQAAPAAVLDIPASSVVHDFHNVLCGILGCAEHALSLLPEGSAARGDLEQICRVAESAASYGKHMLNNARNAAAQHVRSCELDEAVSGAEHMLRRLLGDSISLDLRLKGRGACIWGEANQVEQVLVNLILNARQAMPSGGRLRVRTRLLAIRGYARYAVLRVSDTGLGMDEHTRTRAFEPFFTSRSEHGGTGLGLSNVHALVRQAGGHVIMRSLQGAGTTFTICWPCLSRGSRESVPPSRPSQAPRASARNAGTVLLVEDEALIALAAQHHLEGAGYRVIVARNARQAQLLAVQHRGNIDLVLTDIALPGRADGLDVARAVQSLHPNAVVLYMSAHPRSWLVRQGLLGASTQSIEKPFTRELLVNSVTQALSVRSP
jgi:CheY-like chemotaxis protein